MRKRSKHNLSHYRMHTGDMGQLLPIACVPVLPGDTFQHSTSALVRVSPLNTPVMHPVTVRLHHFFVPNRILWTESENGGWENFITGGADGMNAASPPTIQQTMDKTLKSAYCGASAGPAYNVSALPVRACNKIYNEYYRDQDLVAEIPEDNNQIQNIAWEKDYFTTARPWSSKGPTVTLPIGDQAPVATDAQANGLDHVTVQRPATGLPYELDTQAITNKLTVSGDGTGDFPLYADLSNASQIDINQFRAGFALQRYQEARARYGSRFTEYLQYLGITPSDGRLQRPEYLGGGSTRLNFSEVLQTTPGDTPGIGVGDMYGHGIAGVRSNAYRKFFEEHGYVITMFSVRPKATYQNAVPREFYKTTKEDFFQRELANLGQQEVWKGELVGGEGQTTFAYQDRYDEYRSHPSQVGQDFQDILNAWHLARDLDNTVTLNQAFTDCVPSKRIHQVETDDVLWIMVNHRIIARRMVPRVARPRIL